MADTLAQQNQPLAQKKTPSEEKIHVVVRNRNKILFDADVSSVSSKNDTGVFDVLPEHSNFISLITSPLVLRTPDGKKKEITFDNGIIKVKDNAVHCYIDLLAKKMTETPSNTSNIQSNGSK